MTFALDAVLPIFALIAVGWVLAATRLLGRPVGESLAVFAAKIGIPVLIFRTVVAADLGAVSPWLLWACYFPSAAVTWVLGHLAARRVFSLDQRTAVIAGMGSAFANTVFVGLPLAQRAYGDYGVLIVTMLIAVHMPLMMVAATLSMERAERLTDGAARVSVGVLLRQIGSNLMRNAIVIALAAGLLFRASGLTMPGLAEQTLRSLAQVSGPVSLLSLGMALFAHGIRGDLGAVAVVSALKLVVMPALVLLACRLVGLDAATTGPLVVLAGVPAGINVYLIAMQFRAGESLSSSVVAVTSSLGVVTCSAWLIWLSPA